MNLYAVSASLPGSSSEILEPFLMSDFLVFLYYSRFILPIFIFIVGLALIIKHANKCDKDKGLKVITYILPIIGIILTLINWKKNHKEAIEYLKISLWGIGTYIVICLAYIICYYIYVACNMAGL